MDPPPSRDTGLVKRDPLLKVSDKAPADHPEKARKTGLEEGIEIGKRKIAGNQQAKSRRDTLIKEQNSQIKRLSAELALEAAHLVLAGQHSDRSATLISALTADNNSQAKRTFGSNSKWRC